MASAKALRLTAVNDNLIKPHIVIQVRRGLPKKSRYAIFIYDGWTGRVRWSRINTDKSNALEMIQYAKLRFGYEFKVEKNENI